MAPEVLTGNYDLSADLWSLGVLLYTLVSGYLPFQGENSLKVFEKIKQGSFHFKHKEFDDVSDECKDLIRQLLVTNPNKRITGAQALNHKWFKKFSHDHVIEDHIELNTNVIGRLRNYKGVSYLRRAVMNQLVKMSDDMEVEDLRKCF